jgi:hypothetical protein
LPQSKPPAVETFKPVPEPKPAYLEGPDIEQKPPRPTKIEYPKGSVPY